MRAPIRAKRAPRQQVSKIQTYPSPVGGWNTRDALAAMPPTDALILENWYPRPSYCEIRGGYSDHLTAMTGQTPKTLAIYTPLTGLSKMFVASDSGVYDASTAGAMGASVGTSTNGKWNYVNMGNGTSNYLIMMNGTDKPLYYDGVTWTSVDGASTPALTGITTTGLLMPMVFKGRLMAIEKNSLSFWYLAAGAIGGALTEFQLDSLLRRGGQLTAIATWTFDGGSGNDDYAVFMSSQGEIAVYQGTNPAAANTWALVGVYYLGKPLGAQRCFTQYGGDLIVITENGAFPLSKALQSATINYTTAMTDKILAAFNDAQRLYGSNFGWEGIVFPAQTAVIFNVPINIESNHEQFVMNSQTGSWCKFNAWNAQTFAVFNGELYFATYQKVCKAWSGVIDGVDAIIAYAKTAFSDFKDPNQKKFRMYRPYLSTNGNLSFLTDIDVDFGDTAIAGTATYSVSSGAQWDVSLWDVGTWAQGMEIAKNWTSPEENVGFVAAGKLKIATNSLTIQWMASEYLYEPGGPL